MALEPEEEPVRRGGEQGGPACVAENREQRRPGLRGDSTGPRQVPLFFLSCCPSSFLFSSQAFSPPQLELDYSLSSDRKDLGYWSGQQTRLWG